MTSQTALLCHDIGRPATWRRWARGGGRRDIARAEPDDGKAEQQLLEGVEWATRWQWPAGPYLPVFRLARELSLPLVALNVADEALDRVRPRQLRTGGPARR